MMRLFLALSVSMLTFTSVESFSPLTRTLTNPMQTIQHSSPPSTLLFMSNAPSPIDEIKVKITKIIDQDNLNSILGNTLNGEFGTRGEAYVAAQVFLVLCILFGGLPILGDVLNLLCGPLLMIAGAAAAILGVVDMGSSLSPWPVPTGDDLVTDGIYSQMRHPIYAGLLAIMAGFSVVTGSAPRLLLTAALWYLLDLKSDYEEKQLVKEFAEYSSYREAVPGKFFPQAILAILPWTDSENDSNNGSFQ